MDANEIRTFVVTMPVGTPDEVIASTRTLLEVLCPQHASLVLRWSSRMTRAVGQVTGTRNRMTGETTVTALTYSTDLMHQQPADRRVTIGHEVAHVVAGIEKGHGRAWQIVMLRLGLQPRTYMTREATQELQVVRAALGRAPAKQKQIEIVCACPSRAYRVTERRFAFLAGRLCSRCRSTFVRKEA